MVGSVSNYRAGVDRSSLSAGAELRASFEEQLGILVDEGVSIIALEMLSDVDIATIAIEAAAASGLPLLVGVACEWSPDGTTVVTQGHRMNLHHDPVALGEVLEQLVPAVPTTTDAVLAVMHSDLDVTTAALPIVGHTGPATSARTRTAVGLTPRTGTSTPSAVPASSQKRPRPG